MNGTNQLRAGDTVRHLPTGEEWGLATDQVDAYVYPEGWPPTAAKASDCRLLEQATDSERLETLSLWAGLSGGPEVLNDWRVIQAKHQLGQAAEGRENVE